MNATRKSNLHVRAEDVSISRGCAMGNLTVSMKVTKQEIALVLKTSFNAEMARVYQTFSLAIMFTIVLITLMKLTPIAYVTFPTNLNVTVADALMEIGFVMGKVTVLMKVMRACVDLKVRIGDRNDKVTQILFCIIMFYYFSFRLVGNIS